MSPRDLLLGSFQAAIAAADPLRIVPQHLPQPPKGRTLVVGAGKAAAAMALAVEQKDEALQTAREAIDQMLTRTASEACSAATRCGTPR